MSFQFENEGRLRAIRQSSYSKYTLGGSSLSSEHHQVGPQIYILDYKI